MKLVASFGRSLGSGVTIVSEHGIVSGNRHRAVCRDCGRRDQLSFTNRMSAAARKKQHVCEWVPGPIATDERW